LQYFVSRSAPTIGRRLNGQIPRRGFTLVELLAALGISLLLIAAISAALNIYMRVTTAGQLDVERQQVTRAVIDQLTRDVGSIVFRPAETAAAEGDASAESESATIDDQRSSSQQGTGAQQGSSTETEEEITIAVEDPSTGYSANSVGLVGDSQTLLLNVSRPQRELGYSSPLVATSLTARSSDLMSVSWFLATPGGAGLAGAVGNLEQQKIPASERRSSVYQTAVGLARLEGDRMAIDHADLEMDIDALAAESRVIAPEVVSLQFRYFNGLDWEDSWDSTSMDALPLAIEVTIGFQEPPDKDDKLADLTGIVRIGETVRHVIQVPMAEPYAATSAAAL
jgi:prepilin-type N-terminal cleavage/methylation domain-containing protein